MQPLHKEFVCFEDMLYRNDICIGTKDIRILQLNLGNKCNQSCAHCHVNAGPNGTKNMDKKTIGRVLQLLSQNEEIHTVDITGGAPELNPYFRFLVKELRILKKRVIDRCNLTVFFEDGQDNTPEFLAENKVEIFASLPCYIEENTDFQRGRDVFNKSINSLQLLNGLGYGKKDSGLILNLVYNPIGVNLPSSQSALELSYKKHLKSFYDIEFNNLLTITNMPIKRFERMLIKEGKYDAYLNSLIQNFNPKAASNIMCRELLSIGWDGKLFDCDFNQALGIPLRDRKKTIWNISDFKELSTEISFDNHCFGCTAGNGSSCKGALI